ncbi:MAG: ABC transporter permease [Desulfobacteraceae bacterium]|jgi:ABC-2 type transport system permease protein
MNFSPRRLAAIARKEFLHVLRDWRSLALALAIPMLLIWLFGYALTMDLKNAPMAVWDQSHTPASRDFLHQLDGSPYFVIRQRTDNYRALIDALDRRGVIAALVIPADFSDRLQAGRSTTLQILLEGSDANNANLAMGYINGLTQLFNRKIMVRRLQRTGAGPAVAAVEADIRAWYNPDLRSRNVIVPGIIAVVMVVIAAMLTSVTIAREWETGTMEQLISTPVRVPELVIGKVVPYFVIGLTDVAIAVLMGRFIFHVPLRGNPALLFAMASVFLCGALFLGLVLSIVLKTQVLANQLAIFANYLPTLLLSGFVFSIHNMPPPIQMITYIVPARYFIALLRGIYLKGIGLEVLGLNALLLTAYAGIMVVVAHRKMRLKLEV